MPWKESPKRGVCARDCNDGEGVPAKTFPVRRPIRGIGYIFLQIPALVPIGKNLFRMKATKSSLLFWSFCLALAAPAAALAAREMPTPVRTVSPVCPANLRGTTGLVMVKCAIDEQGNVTAADVVKSTDAAFEEPAVTALKKWKFKPASENGKAVAVSVTVPVKFAGDEAS
jgi:periplasmic protein TonB